MQKMQGYLTLCILMHNLAKPIQIPTTSIFIGVIFKYPTL